MQNLLIWISQTILLMIPITYLLGALGQKILSRKNTNNYAWNITLTTGLIAFTFALGNGILFLSESFSLNINQKQTEPFESLGLVRIDMLSMLMAILISLIGWVILKYSRNYIDGDAREESYRFWFLLTLASVSLLVISGHLVLTMLAWTSTSLAFHNLLIYYPERPKAQLAAHKKFLISRLADTFVFIGGVLLYNSHQTFKISEILAHYQTQTVVISPDIEIAGVLFSFAAILKCAQLPLHGWLMQVMEAPTPVSALLHAGIVNMGGFFIILLAPIIYHVSLAHWILVFVGSVTAVLASLIMMTRVSIKVRLAWSTCAQMGFMLMQCGLGLFELALLHLLAHSFYKAYAFLTSGEEVNHHLSAAMNGKAQPISLTQWSFGFFLAFVSVVGSAWFLNPMLFTQIDALIVSVILTFAIATFYGEGFRRGGWSQGFTLLITGFIVNLIYLGLHSGFKIISKDWLRTSTVSEISLGWVVFAFSSLFILHIILRNFPESPIARAIYPRLYGGFYMDDFVTRITLKLWPAKLQTKESKKISI